MPRCRPDNADRQDALTIMTKPMICATNVGLPASSTIHCMALILKIPEANWDTP